MSDPAIAVHSRNAHISIASRRRSLVASRSCRRNSTSRCTRDSTLLRRDTHFSLTSIATSLPASASPSRARRPGVKNVDLPSQAGRGQADLATSPRVDVDVARGESSSQLSPPYLVLAGRTQLLQTRHHRRHSGASVMPVQTERCSCCCPPPQEEWAPWGCTMTGYVFLRCCKRAIC